MAMSSNCFIKLFASDKKMIKTGNHHFYTLLLFQKYSQTIHPNHNLDHNHNVSN